MTDKCGECGRKKPDHEEASRKREARKAEILSAAIEVSKEKGYQRITRSDVAERAEVSIGLISFYFETVALLRRAIMRAAVEQEIPEIIFQGLAVSDGAALNSPVKLRAKALAWHTAGSV